MSGTTFSPNPYNSISAALVGPKRTTVRRPSASDRCMARVSPVTTNPPPTIVASTADYWYGPPALSGGTTYFWQIVAHNVSGARSATSSASA